MMNKFLAFTACIVLHLFLLPNSASGARFRKRSNNLDVSGEPPRHLGTPDELPPLEGACDKYENKKANGLCKAFCEAQDCDDDDDEEEEAHSCSKLRENFEKITGESNFPCEEKVVCPCWTDEYLDFVKDGMEPGQPGFFVSLETRPFSSTTRVIASVSVTGLNSEYRVFVSKAESNERLFCSSKEYKEYFNGFDINEEQYEKCLGDVLKLQEEIVGEDLCAYEDDSSVASCPCWEDDLLLSFKDDVMWVRFDSQGNGLRVATMSSWADGTISLHAHAIKFLDGRLSCQSMIPGHEKGRYSITENEFNQCYSSILELSAEIEPSDPCSGEA